MRAAGAAQMPAASGIYRQRRAFIALGLRQLAALAATFKSLVAKSKFERYRAHVTPLTPPAAPPLCRIARLNLRASESCEFHPWPPATQLISAKFANNVGEFPCKPIPLTAARIRDALAGRQIYRGSPWVEGRVGGREGGRKGERVGAPWRGPRRDLRVASILTFCLRADALRANGRQSNYLNVIRAN